MLRPSTKQAAIPVHRASDWSWLGLLLAYMILVGLYTVSRVSGRWAESDSAAFTNLIRVFAEEGRLVPVREAYPNGYAFQAVSTFILSLTGLDVAALQQLVYPIIASAVVLPAWLLYRELTGSARGATLAAMLLFTQPEFLFVILRSSHEKFSRTLMLFCLFLLVRSFKVRAQPWLFAVHVGLFYLTAFAFIASNNLLAHSFIVAVAVALALGWFLEKRNTVPWNDRTLPRLFYVALICTGLVYVFTFAVYLPANHDVVVLKDTWDRIAALFLDVQTRSTAAAYTNPYAYVVSGWVSLPAYFAVSIADWLILSFSFVIWLRQGLHWLRRGEAPDTRAAWLLWLLYSAFAVQGGFSLVADLSGALGSNLQHRLFPTFSIVAVGIVASALIHWRPRRSARLARLALALGIFCVAILSVFKATNEPTLSNKWTFYRESELTALEWSNRHLVHARIWTEFDERLRVAFFMAQGEPANGNGFEYSDIRSRTRVLLITQVTRLRSSRLQQPLPTLPDALRVYDNGEAELYRLRPRTPYQH